MTNSNNGAPPSPEATAGKPAMLVLSLDLDTFQVSLGGDTMPISLAQMMCEEALRVLAEQRRIASTSAVAKAIADAQRTQAILDSVRGGRQ